MLAKSQGPSDLEIAKIMLSAEDPAMAGQAVAAVAKDLGETKQHFLHGLELELLGDDQALALLAGVLHLVVQGAEILLHFRGPVLGRLSFRLHGIQLGHHAVQEGLHACGFRFCSIGVCQGIDLVAEPLVGRSLRLAVLVVLFVVLGVRVLLGARGALHPAIKARGKGRES